MRRNEKAESIELHSYCINSTIDSDIDEYDEINEGATHETAVSSYSNKTIKESDFFIQNDVKVGNKRVEKKKKSKRKGKGETLMDIITSELASVTVPLTENLVTTVADIEEKQRSCLANIPIFSNLFRKSRPLRADSEYG